MPCTQGEERAAKDEDGKAYYVPGDMTYREWREKYVDNRVETVYNKKQRNFLQEQLPFMNNGETLFIPTNTVIKSATVIAGNGSDTVLRKSGLQKHTVEMPKNGKNALVKLRVINI